MNSLLYIYDCSCEKKIYFDNARYAAPIRPESSFKVDFRTFIKGFTLSYTLHFTRDSTSSTNPSILRATEPPKITISGSAKA